MVLIPSRTSTSWSAGTADWNRPCRPWRAYRLSPVFVCHVRTQAPPSRPSLIPSDGMGQGTEPVKVHAVQGVDRETHDTLPLFALPVVRIRSYRYAKNSVTFFSVVAHCSTSRFLELPVSRLSPTTACGGGTGEASGAGTTRLAELQYLLRYGGLKQACPPSWARARLLGRPASIACGRA